MPSQHQNRRNILSLSPFFLTLILITIVAVTSIFGQESLKSNTNEKPRLCEIEADPEIFLGEPHDVSAEYKFGFEMVWLSDVSHGPCTNRSKIEYRFDEDYQNRTAKKTLKQFEKMIKTNRKSQKIRGVYTIIIQRYEKANETDRRFDYQVRIMRILRVGLK